METMPEAPNKAIQHNTINENNMPALGWNVQMRGCVTQQEIKFSKFRIDGV